MCLSNLIVFYKDRNRFLKRRNAVEVVYNICHSSLRAKLVKHRQVSNVMSDWAAELKWL